MDRRAKIRYPIECQLEYRIVGGHEPAVVGTGQSINISSEGVLFRTSEPLACGAGIELFLTWPAALDHQIPLKLRITGSVIRSEKNQAVAQITSHEFRVSSRRLRPPLSLLEKSSA